MSVAPEVAEAEVRRVLDRLDIELDEKNVEDVGALRFLARAITKGRLSVDDDARFVLQLEQPLVFKHPTGATFLALDKRDQGVARTVAVMSAVTGKDGAFFSKLEAADFKICQAIAAVFLS